LLHISHKVDVQPTDIHQFPTFEKTSGCTGPSTNQIKSAKLAITSSPGR